VPSRPAAEKPRWWYCPLCFAVNDGLEQSRCWNCDQAFPSRRKNKPWVEMGKKKCEVCGKSYVTWTLPAGTTMTVPDVLGFCPLYLEESHSGPRAYFPPMLPAYYVLEANGYRYDEDKKKVVKVRKK
jgi:hypothetical protein